MKLPRLTNKRRVYLYGVIAAVLAVLLFYKLIEPAAVPVWLMLAGTVLGAAGNTTAAVKLKRQIDTGTLE